MSKTEPDSFSRKSITRFQSKETRFHGRYAKTLGNTMWQAYRPMLVPTLFYLALGWIGRFALLGNTNIMGYWVDSYCSSPGKCRPLPKFFTHYTSDNFFWCLGIATVTGFVFTLAYRSGISRLSAEAVSRVYDETTLRTSRLSMSFFDQNPAGRVMTRFASDYNNIFRIFGGPLAEFIGLTFDLLVMSILITVASPWFLPLWLLQGAVNFWVYRAFLPSLRRERREMALRRSPGISHFSETANGANSIRSFGRQAVFEVRFSKLNDGYLNQRMDATHVFVRFSLSMGLVTAATLLLTGLASVWLVRSGRLSVGSVGVAFAYLGLSANILQSFFEWLGQFEEAMTGLERMNEYLRLPIEPGLRLPITAAFITDHPFEKGTAAVAVPGARPSKTGARIEIQNLWMRYRTDLPPILKGISLDIKAGERLAVVGKTGSGKTSLVQALFRLYPLEQGDIKINGFEADVDGTRLRGLDLQVYRGLLAYITQEATLFLGTLRENLIGPGASKDLDKTLVQALKRVQFLSLGATELEYSQWLDNPIEERGRNLSAGERQLICMARCLLQDAPVVVLDEATSAVDPRSEEILNRATDEFFAGKTQILIAHRLSTVRSCDRVLWLQQGQIHRLGTPAEVLPEFENAALLS